ncbi:MAG: DUF819 family protein [Planctomycetes bacterium]|nr:DUF819 family protein [Planctomycetota bacterium]
MIREPVFVLAILLGVLALLFSLARHRRTRRFFEIVPLLLFAYFVPMLLSNTGLIPTTSPLYDFISTWLLPASLFLLTLSVDIPAIIRLGPRLLILFLGATASIIIGGPLAYLALGRYIPEELRDQAWRGLAALCGSWIGGGANFLALGKEAGATDSIINVMVVIDVLMANLWMAVLLFFAGREKSMDERIGADRTALDELRRKAEAYQAEVRRPVALADLLLMLALAIGGTAAATALAERAAGVLSAPGGSAGEPAAPGWPAAIVLSLKPSTWAVLCVTALGVGLSFTRLRRLEGAGASAVGSLFLYLLVTTIGAKGDISGLAASPALSSVAALWILFHAVSLLVLRRFLKAPIFFAAVGSQANIGGAASAPIVASAFHPALASVGALLAVAGYVMGTGAGLLCMFLLRAVHHLID